MRKSLSLRWMLLSSHVVVVVLSLAVAAVILTLLLRGYQERLALARLADVAIPTYYQAADMVERGIRPAAVVDYLRAESAQLGVRILLIGPDRNVLQDTGPGGDLRGSQLRIPSEALTRTHREPIRGRFVGPGGETHLYVAVPLVGDAPPDSAREVRSLVVAVSLDRVPMPWSNLAGPLAWAGAVALAVAFVAAGVTTGSLHPPLRRLNRAARAMAAGDYEQRITVGGPAEVRELAESFNHMAAEVKRSREVLKEFVANVSHELKTPLTSIRGYVQALRDGTIVGGTPAERALGVVDEEARRLQQLVGQLLELSRLEARQVELRLEDVTVGPLVQHCLEVFELRATDGGVGLVADVPDVLVARADVDRLEQVLTNLVDNALRHTLPSGKVTIRATWSANRRRVQVDVTDTGAGIPPEEIAHLFDRYYVGERGGETSGTGLGLAIAREIVRAMGGEIQATSRLGQGTTFSFDLPAPAARG